MNSALLLALVLGGAAWIVVRGTLDIIPSLPRDNNDFIFL